ncbi:25448_t:CDS:2, partial [Gigaspora rosea]
KNNCTKCVSEKLTDIVMLMCKLPFKKRKSKLNGRIPPKIEKF